MDEKGSILRSATFFVCGEKARQKRVLRHIYFASADRLMGLF